MFDFRSNHGQLTGGMGSVIPQANMTNIWLLKKAAMIKDIATNEKHLGKMKYPLDPTGNLT